MYFVLLFHPDGGSLSNFDAEKLEQLFIKDYTNDENKDTKITLCFSNELPFLIMRVLICEGVVKKEDVTIQDQFGKTYPLDDHGRFLSDDFPKYFFIQDEYLDRLIFNGPVFPEEGKETKQ